MSSIARSIARWIRELDAATLEPLVVEKAKLCLLDMIGVAAQAADLPCSRQAVTFAAAMGGEQATLIGSAQRASTADAAFANATMAHGLVQEDMHTPSVSHIGVVVCSMKRARSGSSMTSTLSPTARTPRASCACLPVALVGRRPWR